MISVIVPVYNVKTYLHQCIDSILAQTYKDFEIILVDDGSTDGSGEICDQYDDSRIHVYHTNNNGQSVARNIGIDNAKGEYITFIDSDDWIEPTLFEKAIEEIEEYDIVGYGCFVEGNEKSSTSICYEYNVYEGKDAIVALINNKLSSTVWDKLYRSKCFSTIRFPIGVTSEDFAITYKLFLNDYKIKYLDECLYHYRIREGSISHTKHTMKGDYDFWRAARDRFYDCKEIVGDENLARLLYLPALAIVRSWAWKVQCQGGGKMDIPFYSEMSEFSKKYYPRKMRKQYKIDIQIGLILSKYNNLFSFYIAHILRKFRKKKKE